MTDAKTKKVDNPTQGDHDDSSGSTYTITLDSRTYNKLLTALLSANASSK